MAKQTLLLLALVGALLLALVIVMTKPRMTALSSAADSLASVSSTSTLR
jgi:hypothetical protein